MQASFNFKPSQKSECGLETGAEMRQPSSNLGPRPFKVWCTVSSSTGGRKACEQDTLKHLLRRYISHADTVQELEKLPTTKLL